jgi:hypothetical protein
MYISANQHFRGGEYKGTVYKNIPPGTSYADSIRIRIEDDSVIKARGFDRMRTSNGGTTKI